jgi:hypothetical protein
MLQLCWLPIRQKILDSAAISATSQVKNDDGIMFHVCVQAAILFGLLIAQTIGCCCSGYLDEDDSSKRTSIDQPNEITTKDKRQRRSTKLDRIQKEGNAQEDGNEEEKSNTVRSNSHALVSSLHVTIPISPDDELARRGSDAAVPPACRSSALAAAAGIAAVSATPAAPAPWGG